MSTPIRTVRARRMRFDYSAGSLGNRHYADGDLMMSHFLAVLSALFPEGEDFFVRSVRRCSDKITDPGLKAQIAGFIGQEVTHGREHRELNERLHRMGYPTRRVDRATKRNLALAERRLPKLVCLAATAALEHYTAVLAETMLSDERAQQMLGESDFRSMLLWHAIEESEHRAVAFDVYRTAGGSEKLRIKTMRVIHYSFLLRLVFYTLLSLAKDRAAYNPVRLARSIAGMRHWPILSREVRARIRTYHRPGFHPDDHDNSELLTRWTAELFGAEGKLAANTR